MEPDSTADLAPSAKPAPVQPGRPKFAEIKDLVYRTGVKFSEDNVPVLAASLSFYAVLSMAPLLVLAVVGGSLYFGHRLNAQTNLLREVDTALGPQVRKLFEDVLKGASRGSSTTVAALLSLVITFFAASNLFLQLDQSVKTIWKIQNQGTLIQSFIRQRLSAFAGVIVFGLATLTWLFFDSWLYWLQTREPGFQGWSIVSFLASLAFLVVFFTVVFRALPHGKTKWSDTWPGAIGAAVGMSIGKLLLNYYFSKVGISEAYGSAGSIVIILLWVYYTSQIYFFGVELTYQYAHRYGSRIGKETELQRS